MPPVSIVQLEPAVLHALAAGDLGSANAATALELPDVFVAPDWIGTWRYRSVQVREDPASAGWITGALVDTADGRVVGKAGYHGPPDEAGMVEVGYAVHPDLRRQGYARAALGLLLERAAAEPDVRVVRASISPANAASLSLVGQFGFVPVGDQWDAEDGLELVLEVPAGARSRGL